MKKTNDLHLYNNNGYSIIELIVALQLFMIVLSFAFTLYHFQSRFMSKWHSDSNILNVNVSTNQLLEGLSARITTIHSISQNSLIYDDESGQRKIIENKDGFLLLNSKQINSSEIKITLEIVNFYYSYQNKISDFKFSQKDVNGDGVLDNIELENIKAIEVELVYSNPNQTIKDLKYIEFCKVY